MEKKIVKNILNQLFFNIVNIEKISDDKTILNEFYILYQDFYFFLCDLFDIKYDKNIIKKNVTDLKTKFDVYKKSSINILKEKYLYNFYYLLKTGKNKDIEDDDIIIQYLFD